VHFSPASIRMALTTVNILSLCAGVISIVIFLAGSFELWRNREHPVVRATLPLINIMINIGYILNSVSTTNQTITHTEPCITYLWLTFIRITLFTTGYLLKALQIYVFSVVSDKLIEELKNTTQETVKAIDQLQAGEDNQPVKPKLSELQIEVPAESNKDEKKCTSIDQLIIERDYIGSKDFLIKAFFVIVGAVMLIPLIINCTQEQYYHPTAPCSDRTTADIIGLALPIIAFIIAFVFLLFKLRNTKDAYGIKYQIVGMTATWFVILIITLIAFATDNPGVTAAWEIFSPGSVLLPFIFGTGLPLYKVYTSKGMNSSSSNSASLTFSARDRDTTSKEESGATGGSNSKADAKRRARNVGELKMNFQTLIQYQNNDRKNAGFDSIYSFCIQMDIAAGNSDFYFRNALLFVRDYTIQQKNLESETGEQLQARQFASAYLLYQKYLADGKGEIDHGRTALSTVLVEEDKLKELQQSLGEAMAKDDYSTTKPLETLRSIYDTTMKETITYLYKSYVLSNYFEVFMKQFHAEQRLNTLAV